MVTLLRPGLHPLRARPAGMPSERYSYLVRETRPGDLLGYWPLWETGGAVAADLSDHGRDGAYTGVELGRPGVGNRTAPYFDGTNDYCNIYSASLASAFTGTAGTVMVWLRLLSMSIWSDNVAHGAVILRADDNNRVYIAKGSGGLNNSIYYYLRLNGAEYPTNMWSPLTTDWMCLGVAWDARLARYYYNGGILTTANITQVWSGALAATTTVIGALSTTPGGVSDGLVAHCAIWKSALSPLEMARLGPTAFGRLV